MILTSSLGRFEFDDHTLLAHAKLIRDSVVGQWFNPKPGNQRLHTLTDIEEFVRAHSSTIIAGIKFAFSFNGDEPAPSHVEELEELPQPPMIPVPPIWIRQALVGDQRPDWMDK